jgi:ATP-dependent exoDNAse (exonuclease V) beta subunit
LTHNFRCRPAIIEWVNQVGQTLFDGFGAGPDERQADWIPLQAGRPPGKGPAVYLLGGSREKQATEIRREEADAVVAAILQAKRENWLKRDDPKVAETRFSDIAILLPTRTNSPAIERALAEAGIPVRVESRSLLFAAQEIRDLTNILAAIDDPTDDVSVVAALRSPAFGVNDAELLAHVNAGGRWDYTRPQPEASPEPVTSGMASLAAFHAARWTSSIGALVERVVAERKLLELAVTGRRPREAWRRLRFVSEQARALGDAGTVGSLRQFVHWLRTQAAENARIAEAVANEPDDDAVRLLTIHAAKGLEFPIVILAGLGVPPRNIAPKVAWSVAGGQDSLAVRAGRSEMYFETPGFDHLRVAERQHSFLERDRLFYVAATRAKERLVVSLYYKANKKPDHRGHHQNQTCSLAECLEEMRLAHPEWPTLQHGMPLGPGEATTSAREDTPEQRQAWGDARAATVAALGRERLLAVTAIAHAHDVAAPEDKPEPVDDDQPWKKGRAGTSVGRAVHAVLQTVDLETGRGLAETARTQAAAEGIADEAERIARLAESARTSRAVREAVHGGRLWRELYAGATIDGVLVEGFIDLLYETPEGLVVVDYKTDSLRDADAIDRAMERYRLQGAAYAVLLEEALGRPVAGVVFVFCEPRDERAVTNLEATKAQVRAIIARNSQPTAV